MRGGEDGAGLEPLEPEPLLLVAEEAEDMMVDEERNAIFVCITVMTETNIAVLEHWDLLHPSLHFLVLPV